MGVSEAVLSMWIARTIKPALIKGRTGNFPVRQGSKRIRNVSVAVMIDYLACLFALALFLFLPSGDALCALFFFGRQLRLSMRWPDQCSWHALCPIRSGIAASKIFLGNACSSHEAAEGIPLSFKQISGRLAGGTTQELLNVKGRLMLQHGLRCSHLQTESSSWNYLTNTPKPTRN